ncbi:hypothetical protein C8Q80DRAFT_1130612 [Daedaleopsis nitida]|nr:hypothetical protein C8Q80DRAFT_1130612 [Daedaleopsis nitida]
MPRKSQAGRSPRTTRSRARLPLAHPAEGDLSESLVHISVLEDAFSDAQSIPTIPVMNASSMEPIVGRLPPPPPINASERKHRHKMTDLQLLQLEGLYRANPYPTRQTKDALAKEIGMSSKSVLIWFQNRRQDRRKKSGKGRTTASAKKVQSSSTSKAKQTAPKKSTEAVQAANTASATALPSLTTAAPICDVDSPSQYSDGSTATSQTYNPIYLRPPTFSRCSSLTLASEYGSTTGAHQKHTSSSSHSLQHPLPASALGHAHRAHPGTDTDNTPSPHMSVRALKPNLDWACANSAARRNHGASVYRDEDDSEGESTEFETELAGRAHTRTRNRAAIPFKPLKGPRDNNFELEKSMDVSREYETVPPDLALGASLLLSLKYSAD